MATQTVSTIAKVPHAEGDVTSDLTLTITFDPAAPTDAIREAARGAWVTASQEPDLRGAG